MKDEENIEKYLVTIQVSFLLRRLRRRGEGEGRGHPAPRQGALQAPWNSLMNSYNIFISIEISMYMLARVCLQLYAL